MSSAAAIWQIRNKNNFLRAMMGLLAGNAHISLEGYAPVLPGLMDIAGASNKEATVCEKEGFSAAPTYFVSVPLELETIRRILSKLGGSIPRGVLHIVIEKDGERAFGAYDDFHPECIYFGHAVTEEMIASLIEDGLLQKGCRKT